MGFALVLAGLCFTFEPSFRALDLLPDFLGMLLVITGLTKLSKIDENLRDARKNAKVLFWISFVKLFVCVWMNVGHKDFLLPGIFIFSVIECMFMLEFFRNLYIGIEYTLERFGKEKTVSYVSSTFSMAMIFTIVSRILNFVPQIIKIIAQNEEMDLSYAASRRYPLSFVEPYLELFCLVVALLLGIIYLCVTIRFFLNLFRDKVYKECLFEKHDKEYLCDRERVVTDVLKGTFPAISLGVFFFADFSVDAIGLLPNTIGFCLIMFTFFKLRKITKEKSPAYIITFFGIVASTINYIYMTKINLGINYIYSVESFNVKEFDQIKTGFAFLNESVISIIEGIVFVLCICVLCSVLSKLFCQEKRKVGLFGLVLARVLSIVSALLFVCRNVVKTYAATFVIRNSAVYEYVVTKSMINTEKKYLEALEHPLIRTFEKIESVQHFINIASFLAIIACAYIFISISTKTEGKD